jgi:hypothetical protein
LAALFTKNEVSFVTFNYDRALEHFLYTTLSATFGASENDVGRVLSQLPFIHLHGRLGHLPWQGSDGRAFEPTLNRTVLETCVRAIKIMNEGPDVSTAEFNQAKELMEKSERIYFLGVGFNDVNLQRIGLSSHTNSKVSSTGLGLNQTEHARIAQAYGAYMHVHLHVNCKEMLRSHVAWD